jgi:hypothetical protein
MGQVTQNGEQHVLFNVIPFRKVFGKGKISKTMTIQKHQNSTKNSQRKHNNSLRFIIVILQHIPIAMITKTCNRKQSCCTVTYCPLVTAWATTSYKFQGFEAGFDPNDHFKHLIVDPGDLTTKQQNPGILYATMSRAKTMGQMTPNHPHPKDRPYSGQDWESVKTEF